MEYKLPNFLIAGAARSGTTSLYYYLNQHPEVFMPPHKETKFFALQTHPEMVRPIIKKTSPQTIDMYKKIFKKAVTYKAVGEADVINLYLAKEVIPLIKNTLGDIKIIIILRNPIERTISAYTRSKQIKEEKYHIKEALQKEPDRLKKGTCFMLHYTKVGLYYEQLKAYLNGFSEVKIYLFEELQNNRDQLIKDIFSFLNVDNSFNPDISKVHNESGISFLPKLSDTLKTPNKIREYAKKILELFLTKSQIANIGVNINKWTLKKRKMDIPPETKAYLKDVFRKDIKLTEKLIGKDLSGWLKD